MAPRRTGCGAGSRLAGFVLCPWTAQPGSAEYAGAPPRAAASYAALSPTVAASSNAAAPGAPATAGAWAAAGPWTAISFHPSAVSGRANAAVHAAAVAAVRSPHGTRSGAPGLRAAEQHTSRLSRTAVHRSQYAAAHIQGLSGASIQPARPPGFVAERAPQCSSAGSGEDAAQ